MGDTADVHCYTLEEFLRRRARTPIVKAVAERGLLLFEDSDPLYPLPPRDGNPPPEEPFS
jgi:hypothetical protein